MALLDGGQALVEFGQVRIALDLCQLAVQIHAFLLGKIVRAVALDVVASRLVTRGILNGHTQLQCFKGSFLVYHIVSELNVLFHFVREQR